MSEDFPTIIIHGNYDIYIEAFDKIQEFNDSVIELKSKKFRIKITGKNLIIEYMNHDDMKISGIIEGITINEAGV